MMWRLAPGALLAAVLNIGAAQAAAPTAWEWDFYGQSTMYAGTAPSGYTSFNASMSGSGVLTVGTNTLNPSLHIGVGSYISCSAANYPNTDITVTSLGTGTGQSGTYNTTYSGAGWGSVGCSATVTEYAPTLYTRLTLANQNANAFMPTPTPYLTPNTVVGTLAWNNQAGLVYAQAYALLTSQVSCCSLLSEQSVGSLFLFETPVTSAIAQLIAGTSLTAPNAIVATNAAYSSGDWSLWAQYPLPPSQYGTHASTNLGEISKIIKNAVQSSTTALPGLSTSVPWNYRKGGVMLRLGETAATGKTLLTNASWVAGATSISLDASASYQNGSGTDVTGWCVFDVTQSKYLGYATSWTTGSVSLTAAGAAYGSGGATNHQITLTSCHDGWMSAMRAMKAFLTAEDVSDAPDPRGVPVFATVPSSSQFGTPVTGGWVGFNTYRALGDLSLADRNFVTVGPSYMCRYQIDHIHPYPCQSALVGAYEGKWAAWWQTGRRTAPFVMTNAQRLTPSQMDGAHYGIRVTFQMPPSATTPEKALAFYSDSNIPQIANYGFCYLDGTYEAGGSNFLTWTNASSNPSCASSASGIGIYDNGTQTSPILATTNSRLPGAANQIDIPLTGDPGAQTNPKISYAAQGPTSGQAVFGDGGTNLFMGNVVNSDCTAVANSYLSGLAFPNAACGAGNNYLIDFAIPSEIGLYQTKQVQW